MVLLCAGFQGLNAPRHQLWPTKFWGACYSTLPGPSNTSSPTFRSLSSCSSCSSFAFLSPPPPHLFFFCYCCRCFLPSLFGAIYMSNQPVATPSKENAQASLLSQQLATVIGKGEGIMNPFSIHTEMLPYLTLLM